MCFGKRLIVQRQCCRINYRSSHPETYLFLLSKNMFVGWKHPKIRINLILKQTTLFRGHVEHALFSSGAVSAETSLRSPRILLVFINKKCVYKITVYTKKTIHFGKKLHCFTLHTILAAWWWLFIFLQQYRIHMHIGNSENYCIWMQTLFTGCIHIAENISDLVFVKLN